MPTPAPFPMHLRTILKASKSRSQPAAFSMADPRRGFGYVQATGTDTPVFWDVMFRFTQAEAVVFQLFFTQIIRRGIDEFTMPIRTEFGLLTHTCRFLPDSLLTTTEVGGTWCYKATIMARAQIIPQEFIDAAELIFYLEDLGAWMGVLDQAMNVEMPEA